MTDVPSPKDWPAHRARYIGRRMHELGLPLLHDQTGQMDSLTERGHFLARQLSLLEQCHAFNTAYAELPTDKATKRVITSFANALEALDQIERGESVAHRRARAMFNAAGNLHNPSVTAGPVSGAGWLAMAPNARECFDTAREMLESGLYQNIALGEMADPDGIRGIPGAREQLPNVSAKRRLCGKLIPRVYQQTYGSDAPPFLQRDTSKSGAAIKGNETKYKGPGITFTHLVMEMIGIDRWKGIDGDAILKDQSVMRGRAEDIANIKRGYRKKQRENNIVTDFAALRNVSI